MKYVKVHLHKLYYYHKGELVVVIQLKKWKKSDIPCMSWFLFFYFEHQKILKKHTRIQTLDKITSN